MSYSTTSHPNYSDLVSYGLEDYNNIGYAEISKHLEYCQACSKKVFFIAILENDLANEFIRELALDPNDLTKI